MSTFNKRVQSKVRINELEKVFIDAIESYSNKEPDLTMNEVGSVMLKMLSEANYNEIKESLK